MKKFNRFILLFSICFFLFTIFSHSQSPQSFNFQLIARDTAGLIFSNRILGLQISILQDSENGSIVYCERHTATSNKYGLVNIEIGTGSVVSGIFSAINWGAYSHFIKLEIDPAGGTGYFTMGTTPLVSVPYALYAANAGNVVDTSSTNELQALSISNDTVFLSNGGFVKLPPGFWSQSGNNIYSNNTGNVGIGTSTPSGKFIVQGDSSAPASEPLLEVKNKAGEPVFIVYQDSVKVIIPENSNKATSQGGFAVSGRSSFKAEISDYLVITPDSARIYLDTSPGKATSQGGFAVSGRSSAKETSTDYLNVSVNTNETITPSQPRILWYPTKEAFLTGRVLIESPDSIGTNSFAAGFESKAIGNFSQALGYQSRSLGRNSMAIGYYAEATGANSYALGNLSIASDSGSYAIGTGATATGLRSFALGSRGIDLYGFTINATKATGAYSYAFGMGSVALNQGSFAFGTQDSSSGRYSLAMGNKSKAIADMATAIGSGTLASGSSSLAMGDGTKATGQSSTAFGTNTVSGGYASTAMGNSCIASGQTSFAVGSNTKAIGSSSDVAMGDLSIASGGISTALGYNTVASGFISTATGADTKAGGYSSTAMGREINAAADNTFGIGLNSPWPASWTINQPNTMAIMGGNVGIGTVAPDKLLHVAGDARIEGDLYYGFGFSKYTKPDYVFDKEYKELYNIIEVDQYIKKNKHLPWVTSASNEKDGVNFTRLGFETLEAVENLQLQIIDLKKENIELTKVVEGFESEMQLLRSEIINLKKKK